MILILSHNYFEESTNDVLDWLDHYNADFARLNGDDLTNSAERSIILDKQGMASKLKLEDIVIDTRLINVVWNRRWLSNEMNEEKNFSEDTALSKRINKHLTQEYKTFSKTFFHSLDKKKWISNHKYQQLNKIEVLSFALDVGLNIPETLITDNKTDLVNFININGEVITKSISEASFFNVKEDSFSHYTCKIDKLDEIGESFFPSLFQTNIKKQYEIRTFYFDGKLYSMAIFSQNNDQTEVDFRRYDYDKPNRFVPYNLPIEVENKIHQLMLLLNLDTGSIDLIRDLEGDYIFLEVNPRGQFGMISEPCNLFLEEKIAKYLISKDKNDAKRRD